MKVYDPDRPLVSLHVPKTGGKSLAHSLKVWFSGNLLFHYPSRLSPNQTLNGRVCVHGHFNAARGFGVDDHYPDADQFIAFLREPFDRAVSLWFHIKSRGRLENCVDFPSFLRMRIDAEVDELSFMQHFPGDGTPAAFTTWLDTRSVFIGITERYNESISALSSALGRPKAASVHLNSAVHSGDLKSWRPYYERHFASEFEIYQAALERNSELLRRYQPEFPPPRS